MAAGEGGQIVRRSFGTASIQAKAEYDLVTEADLASERRILEILREAYPDFNVYAEESGSSASGGSGRAATSASGGRGSEYTWLVDPLDGTHNFSIGFPYFGVSIALLKGEEAILGVIYNPVLDDLHTAERGREALANGQPLKVAPSDGHLDRANVAWGQGHRLARELPRAQELQQRIESQAKRLLRPPEAEAPSLDWCLLARGAIQAVLSYDSEIEDREAGALIAQEAGCIVTDFRGGPCDSSTRRILAASSPSIHRALLELTRDAA